MRGSTRPLGRRPPIWLAIGTPAPASGRRARQVSARIGQPESQSGARSTAACSGLGSREAFPPEVSEAVDRLWIEPTLTRTVNGRPAHVPFDVYIAFLDTPEVTAAAARFRGIGSYEIQALDNDRYWASDGNGARGIAQVLRREPRRLVLLSRVEHTGPARSVEARSRS